MQGGQPDSLIKFGLVSLWSVQHVAPPVLHSRAEQCGPKIQLFNKNDADSRFYLQSDHQALDSVWLAAPNLFLNMPRVLEQ